MPRVLEIERVIRKHRSIDLQRCNDRLRSFTVELAGRSLPPAFLPFAVGEPNPDGAMIALATPRYDERVLGPELQHLYIHA